MNRMYNVSRFMEIVERFKKEYPDFNFTTDIIVGFPGETEADFEETCRIAREAEFSHIHTFRYSRRKGTRADRMEDQVPEKVKSVRSERIREISDSNKQKYYRSMTGKSQTVLIEKISGSGMAQGYGEHYIPLRFRGHALEVNSFHNIILDKSNIYNYFQLPLV